MAAIIQVFTAPISGLARLSRHIRRCLVTYAFGASDLGARAIRNAGAIVKGIYPLAGLKLVFKGHRTHVAANGHIDDNDVVWIIPHGTKRVPAHDVERGRSGGRSYRSAAQPRLVLLPSSHVGTHVHSCAAIDGQDARSFAMDGKIANRRVLTIGKPIKAESCPDLRPGSVGG